MDTEPPWEHLGWTYQAEDRVPGLRHKGIFFLYLKYYSLHWVQAELLPQQLLLLESMNCHVLTDKHCWPLGQKVGREREWAVVFKPVLLCPAHKYKARGSAHSLAYPSHLQAPRGLEHHRDITLL